MTRFTRFALAVLPILTLAACASGGAEPLRAAAPLTPTEQFGIEVRERPEQILLRARTDGLSAAQDAALSDLAWRWTESGGGEITIQAPLGGDAAAGRATADAARARLVTLGMPPERLRLVGYNNTPDLPVAVIVGFASHEAVGPVCGRDWENLSKTGANKPYRQFGCANTANLAAQIANPGDLLNPRTMGPADAARRSVVLDKYRKGETTSAARDDQAAGMVSSAVAN